MTSIPPLLAQVEADPTFSWWWDVAQKVGAGATFVMGVVLCFLWRAYQAKDAQLSSEVAYSKERDKQTLTVIMELTTLIRGIDERDKKAASDGQMGTAEILKSIQELKSLVREHFISHRATHSRDAA